MLDVIREAEQHDLAALLGLYLFLHETETPAETPQLRRTWQKIVCDPEYHILLGEKDGMLCSSVTVVVIPNLTRGPRPYALIENVVTHPGYRGRGCASALLARAVEIAREAGCYKVMLMTGSREESTLRFYRNAGFDPNGKKAFVMRLN